MLAVKEQIVDDALRGVAELLDIAPHRYRDAMERYCSLKEYLEKANYPGIWKCPKVYLQGSFRLGTVVRPYKKGKDADYDIDMVCELAREKNSTLPSELKKDVGVNIKRYAHKNKMGSPEDKRRCWALNYAPDSEGIGFHVDVLPCLPDVSLGLRISHENPNIHRYAETTIAITNRDEDVHPPQYDWRSSNPDGYAKWFYDINQPGFVMFEREQKELLFARHRTLYSEVGDVPDELVRTPLQRCIQILKRHRDVYFAGHKWETHKPISVIITTLAGRLYRGRAQRLRTLQSALTYILEQLIAHAGLLEGMQYLSEDVARHRLIQRVGNEWYIPNPVNPHLPGDPQEKGENFADRWHEDNHLGARVFFDWISNLKRSVHGVLESASLGDIPTLLGSSLKTPLGGQARNKEGQESIILSGARGLSRFDVPQRQIIPWREGYRYQVSVTGQYQYNDWWHSFKSDSSPLPKGCPLLFRATTTAPQPFSVYWQVVNTGREAEAVAGLRGGIFASKGRGIQGLEQREDTAYRGMHWIECFIVKNEECVARSGEFVVNIR